MLTTYNDYKRANPSNYVPNGHDLDHAMEYIDRTGWETCIKCGVEEWPTPDDVCPDSLLYIDGQDEWDDYAYGDNEQPITN